MRKFLIAACVILGPAFCSLESSATGCEVAQLQARSGSRTFYASGIPLEINGAKIFVTPDHFLPFDLSSETGRDSGVRVRVRGSSGAEGFSSVYRRDWASDLMILLIENQESSWSPSPCRISSRALKSGQALRLRGFVSGTSQRVDRDARVLDPKAPEVRIAAKVNLIKARGDGEKGMSGGALLDGDGSVVGMVLQDWISPNHPNAGGVYAISAQDLEDRVRALLASDRMESSLPFGIRRGIPELSAFGIRFRPGVEDVPQAAPQMAWNGGGSGHPDGIGGESARAALEIVGLSGEKVPIEWEPMRNILKRIQLEGGAQMLVRRTEEGILVGSLVELGRLLIEPSSSPPALDFIVQDISSIQGAAQDQDLSTLAERAVILSSQIAQRHEHAVSAAQEVRSRYGEWVRNRELSRLRGLLRAGQSVSMVGIDGIGESQTDLKPVIELQVILMRIEKALGRVTSQRGP